MSSNQLFLDFSDGESLDGEFILTKESEKSYKFLEKFFQQKIDGENLVRRAIIKGEEFSGKTILLNSFLQKFDINKIDQDFLSQGNSFVKGHFYILEDIDKIEDNLLFHLINSAYENQAFLLMSARKIDVFKLKDLISRIKNIFICEIEKPEVESLKILLLNFLSKKQLKISDNVIDFVIKNCSRNYQKLFEIAFEIEKFCFENKKSPQIKDLSGLFF